MSRIEALESRIAPATVTVSLTAGALNLSSDGGAHDVTITGLDATTFQLTGAAGTSFHVEGGGADSATLVLVSPLKTLTATLGDGNDQLSLVGLNIAGEVTIAGGEGTNAINIDTVSVKGSLTISGGAGADTVNATGGVFSVKKDATLDLGNGTNAFVANASLIQVGKNFSYTGGSGADSFTTPQGGLTVGGDFSMAAGAGAMTVDVQATNIFNIGKNLIVDSSASLAGDVVSLRFTSYFGKIGGDVRIADGAGNLQYNQYFIGINSVRGNFSIATGAGSSAVYFSTLQLTGKSVTIDASASSSSTVAFNGYSGTILKGFKYTGGAGADSVYFSVLGGTGRAFNASLDIDLGGGDNDVAVGTFGSTFKTISIVGGAGKDQISLSLFGGKASNLKIDAGDGIAESGIALFNSTVSGAVTVTHGATPGTSQFIFSTASASIGSLAFTSAATKNDIQFGTVFSGGGYAPAFAGLTVKSSFQLTTGSGDDTIALGTPTNVKVGKEISFQLGDGTNVLTGTPSNLVTKKFSVTGGSGADTVSLVGAGNNLGAVSLALGDGVNAATLKGAAGQLQLASLSFISTSAAANTDSLTLARIVITGKVDAKFGAAATAVTVDDSTFGNLFTIDTGAGSDMVKLDNGATNTGSLFAKAVDLKLGDGDDLLILGGNGSSSVIRAKATFTADSGTGSNTLNNDAGNVFAKEPVFIGFPA